ncbi:hypothetical protein CVT24_004506 [Panaeolus cyanescens]|uniref:F-box domain-containing protein n=1 Tax=Panaeolus cyanescens TaxID=181874 RepID=A0A409YBR9_9AGAR|nr:hypothetical protein CVT24_004506 [Panaeolus cyanescens]
MLPLDLLEIIIGILDSSTISSCCRVNKLFYSVSLDVLYRHIQPTRSNLLRICVNLSSNPQLAARVRSFVIPMMDGITIFRVVIQQVLLHLTRLRTLVLHFEQDCSWILPSKSTCPFQLNAFSTSFSYNSHLASFLESQVHLQHLHLASAVAHDALVPPCDDKLLPNLVSLHAPLPFVEAWTTRRPIHSISILSQSASSMGITESSARSVLSTLTTSSSPSGVQRLQLPLTFVNYLDFKEFRHLLPSVTIMALDADTVIADDPDEISSLTDAIESFVYHNPQLTHLSIQFFHFPAYRVQNLDYSEMITSIFAASDPLAYVTLTFNNHRLKYICKRTDGRNWLIVN